ncbi:MAG: hypothetical protein ACI92E_002438 [Oceanicoccus sp.]|jgi:uncharacterized protein YdiU (UPF0061 family)
MTSILPINFDNSYSALPDVFYKRQRPTPVSNPQLIRVNHPLAKKIGIDPLWLESQEGINVVAGNLIPEGADPIATAYAGYQFGQWNPQLGDGRAVLLGETLNSEGDRYDIQLKGSGPTPYSRGGDGRAPLGPILREYIVSDAMANLGIASTRVVAAVTSGETVFRESVLPGAVLMRVGKSHIRFGTFQYFTAQGDIEATRRLADHVIERHFPQSQNAPNPYSDFLDRAIIEQVNLVASWQSVGFIHGVMNTDNMLVTGETIDYGPCAFMDQFDPDKVFSSIDRAGRYAYKNQPGITHWNLVGLAQSLIPLLDKDETSAVELAQKSIDRFPTLFNEAYYRILRKKLGLCKDLDDDETLIKELLSLMAKEKTDFTLTFRRLSELVDPARNFTLPLQHSIREIFEFPASFSTWINQWSDRIDTEDSDRQDIAAMMLAINPAFIARNHLVEEAIDSATHNSDLKPFNQLVDVLEEPYIFDSNLSRYAMPPEENQMVKQTFCGT